MSTRRKPSKASEEVQEAPAPASRPVREGAVAPLPTNRLSDQELMDQRNAELDAERELHNEKTGGGAYPLSTER